MNSSAINVYKIKMTCSILSLMAVKLNTERNGDNLFIISDSWNFNIIQQYFRHYFQHENLSSKNLFAQFYMFKVMQLKKS